MTIPQYRYIADEVWDGKFPLIFNGDGEQLTAVTLNDGVFDVHIADKCFRIAEESQLEAIFDTLKTVPLERRPLEQLKTNMDDPTKFPCGYRCNMCLLNCTI